jgi:diadenosine tetraphosphate (Ap4A) HIT family hydrolase
MMAEHCEMCRGVAAAIAGKNPHLVHEFEHSFLLVGSHQRFAGYCVLVAKTHVREPFELPLAALDELMTAARAIQEAYGPWKINYGCYGNQVPHVHWHLFPRYETDPMLKQVPWMQSAEFERSATTPEQAREVIERVRKALRAR